MRFPTPSFPAARRDEPSPLPARRTGNWVVAALVALTLFALALRWAGLGAQSPQAREADPALVHYAAFYDRPAGAPMNDAVYPSTVYPVLLGRLLVALPGSGYPIAAPADAPLGAHLDAAAAPYLRARWMIAILSLLAIPFTYLFSRNWLEPAWALFAAALVTTSMLALEMGVVGKPHGALLGFSALALWSMLRLLWTGRARDYALAGVATALALGSLNTGGFLIPSLALAHWLGWRADRRRERWRWFALAVALCAVSFFTSYWFLFAPPSEAVRVPGALNLGQQAIDWDSWGYQGFLDMIPRVLEHDPALVVVAGFGVAALAWGAVRARVLRVREEVGHRPRTTAAALRVASPVDSAVALNSGAAQARAPHEDRVRSANLVVGLFVVIFVLLFGMHARFYPRFAMPVLPVLALLGAVGVRALTRLVAARIASSRAERAIGLALVALTLAFPLYAVLHLARLRARDDTAQLAAQWVAQNLTPESGTIALDVKLTLPVFASRAALEQLPQWALQPWTRYQLEVKPSTADDGGLDLRPLYEPRMFRDRRFDGDEIRERLTALRPRWAIVTVPAVPEAHHDATRAAVRELHGEPVASFLPFGPGGSLESILTREADPRYLRHLLNQERLGPPIEIYALP